MKKQRPILKRVYQSEKAVLLAQLHTKESNRCLRRFNKEKVTFEVDSSATKIDVAAAVQEAYGVAVDKVHMICVKPKPVLFGRRRSGKKRSFKKAIVTLKEGESIADKLSETGE